METHIQTMAGHWLKVSICVLFFMSTQVHGQSIEVNVTFIKDATAKGAVCLDGSPGAYHYAKGFGEGVNNWIVYLQGGGWCGSKGECEFKAGMSRGSTENVTVSYFATLLSPKQTVNPDFYNWNRVVIRYCDSASYMADVEEVDPETNFHFRGARIFKAAIEELLAKGMINATNAILAGNSAGGLATILNCDRFRAFLPHVSRVKCIADASFFIHAKNLPGLEIREQIFANVVKFHGLAKVLPKSCTSRMDPSLCLFPENVVEDIKTPLFILNSDFDQYQLSTHFKPPPGGESLWLNCTGDAKICTNIQLESLKKFRTAFLETLMKLQENPSRGMFINSCSVHDMLDKDGIWTTAPKIQNKTVRQAFADWYFDRKYVRLIDTQNDSPIHCKG